MAATATLNSKRGKRHGANLDGWESSKAVPLAEAIKQVKAFKPTKFDQTIEICMHLGINAKQADQAVRGSISLPHGIGVSRRVIAFCGDDQVAAAKEAGASEAGGPELVKKIEGGWMEFDVAVATPDMMRVISKLGRILGPKGLMPSPKSGSVVPNVVDAVREFAAGKVEFRHDAGGNVHAAIGRVSFDEEKLTENGQAFIDTIVRMRPAVAKGIFVKKVCISATMSPGVLVEI